MLSRFQLLARQNKYGPSLIFDQSCVNLYQTDHVEQDLGTILLKFELITTFIKILSFHQ